MKAIGSSIHDSSVYSWSHRRADAAQPAGVRLRVRVLVEHAALRIEVHVDDVQRTDAGRVIVLADPLQEPGEEVRVRPIGWTGIAAPVVVPAAHHRSHQLGIGGDGADRRGVLEVGRRDLLEGGARRMDVVVGVAPQLRLVVHGDEPDVMALGEEVADEAGDHLRRARDAGFARVADRAGVLAVGAIGDRAARSAVGEGAARRVLGDPTDGRHGDTVLDADLLVLDEERSQDITLLVVVRVAVLPVEGGIPQVAGRVVEPGRQVPAPAAQAHADLLHLGPGEVVGDAEDQGADLLAGGSGVDGDAQVSSASLGRRRRRVVVGVVGAVVDAPADESRPPPAMGIESDPEAHAVMASPMAAATVIVRRIVIDRQSPDGCGIELVPSPGCPGPTRSSSTARSTPR